MKKYIRLDRQKTFSLLRWIELKKPDMPKMTVEEAAKAASNELGFEITSWIIKSVSTDVGDIKFARPRPPIRASAGKRQYNTGLRVVAKQLADLCSQLNYPISPELLKLSANPPQQETINGI